MEELAAAMIIELLEGAPEAIVDGNMDKALKFMDKFVFTTTLLVKTKWIDSEDDVLEDLLQQANIIREAIIGADSNVASHLNVKIAACRWLVVNA